MLESQRLNYPAFAAFFFYQKQIIGRVSEVKELNSRIISPPRPGKRFQFSCLFAGPPVIIEVNMQVRSMGPISEMDMVGSKQDNLL